MDLRDELNIVSGLCAQRLMVNYQNGEPVHKQIEVEMLNDLHLADMDERTFVVFLDLAMIKARIGQAIIDDRWFDNEGEPQWPSERTNESLNSGIVPRLNRRRTFSDHLYSV